MLQQSTGTASFVGTHNGGFGINMTADPLGISAAQAMLSLSQGAFLSHGQASYGNLPLTPPGSPEEKALTRYHSSPAKPVTSTPYYKNTASHEGAPVMTSHSDDMTGTSGAQRDLSNYMEESQTPPMQQHQDPATSFLHSAQRLLPSTMSGALTASLFGAAEFYDNPILARALVSPEMLSKNRARGEKKKVPVDQKDERYFERRSKNNVAAKKSRDLRKQREEDITVRAMALEKDNAFLRAQVSTLREEANSLRTMLMHKRQVQLQQAAVAATTLAMKYE